MLFSLFGSKEVNDVEFQDLRGDMLILHFYSEFMHQIFY